jgi:hypothetical protein
MPFSHELQLGCHMAFVMGSNGYITDLGQMVRPRHFWMGELFIRHMHWSKWNRPVVKGSGTYRDPQSGKTKRIRIRLTEPGYCPVLYATIYFGYRIQLRRHGSWHGSTGYYYDACAGP